MTRRFLYSMIAALDGAMAGMCYYDDNTVGMVVWCVCAVLYSIFRDFWHWIGTVILLLAICPFRREL